MRYCTPKNQCTYHVTHGLNKIKILLNRGEKWEVVEKGSGWVAIEKDNVRLQMYTNIFNEYFEDYDCMIPFNSNQELTTDPFGCDRRW